MSPPTAILCFPIYATDLPISSFVSPLAVNSTADSFKCFALLNPLLSIVVLHSLNQ